MAGTPSSSTQPLVPDVWKRLRPLWLRLRHGPPPDAPPPDAAPSDAQPWSLAHIGGVPAIACLTALLTALALSVYFLRRRRSDESDEREEEGEATHHDATQTQQRGAALYEAAAMATAPVEPAPCLSPGAGGPQLLAEGVVCLRGVVSDATCAALLRGVNAQLAAELAAQPKGRRGSCGGGGRGGGGGGGGG